MLANDLIEVFLEDQLHGLERDEIKTVKIPKSKMNWTGSKTALIETLSRKVCKVKIAGV
ncbi:RteC domain-containing protein [Zunongwangia sp.]|uniref:RteC domain-containing protein n=1 Tax=Zunongwangia sp. TaxID=1965325 RepID=UPI003AA7BD38